MGGQAVLDRYVDALVPLPEHVALHVRHSLEDEEECGAGLQLLLMFVDERHAPPKELHARLLEILEKTTAPSLAVHVFNALKQIQRYHRCGAHSMLWTPVEKGTRQEWTKFMEHVHMLLPGTRVFNALFLVQYYVLILEESLANNINNQQNCLLARLLLASGNAEGARRELVVALFDVLSPRRGDSQETGEEESDGEEEAEMAGGEEGDSYLVAHRLLQLLVSLEGMHGLLAPIMSGFSTLRSLNEKERFLETLTLPKEKTVLLESLLVRDFRHPDPKQARDLREAHGPCTVARLCSCMLLEPKAISEEMRGKNFRPTRLGQDYLVLVVCHLVQAFLLQVESLSAEEATELRKSVARFCKVRSRGGSDHCQMHCHFLAAFVNKFPVQAK